MKRSSKWTIPIWLLRPGMTATAEIVTTNIKDAVLVPNAALRFTPEGVDVPGQPQNAQQSRGALSALMPTMPRRMFGGQQRGGGNMGRVWILEDGKPVRGDVPARRDRRPHDPGAAARPDRRPSGRFAPDGWRNNPESQGGARAQDRARHESHRRRGSAEEMTGMPTPPTSRDRAVAGHEGVRRGRRRGARAARHRPRDRAGRVRRRHGPERLGQVDVHEHPRLPRHADLRRLSLSRRAGRLDDLGPARAAAPESSRFRVPGVQPAEPHDRARERRAAAGLSAPARRSSGTRGRARRCTKSVSTAARRTCRVSCPAASSSASRSRAPSSRSRKCCSPTSRRAISTRRPAARS